MRNFVLAMVVVFLVLCVPWFCVAQAGDYYKDDIMEWYHKNNERKDREVYQADQKRQQYKNRVQQTCLRFSDTEAEYNRCMYVKGGL